MSPMPCSDPMKIKESQCIMSVCRSYVEQAAVWMGASPAGPWTIAPPSEYSTHETGQLVRNLPSSLLRRCSTMLDKHLSKTR